MLDSSQSPKIKIGWREWAQLPDLGLPAVKFKTDTGARTSALHATDIDYFQRDSRDWVRFNTQPVQHQPNFFVACEALLLERRVVTNSGGQQETRPVIKTRLVVGDKTWQIKLTLTNRERMKFRMLLGRRAMTHRCLVDPSASYLQGRLDPFVLYSDLSSTQP